MIYCKNCCHYSDGFCHLNPPVIVHISDEGVRTNFIPVGPQNWCGYWRLSLRALFKNWSMARTG